MPLPLRLSFFLLMVLAAAPAAAQPGIEAARSTLKGAPAFYVSTVVEAGMGLSGTEPLMIEVLQGRAEARLQRAGLRVLRGAEARQGDAPYLNVHINVLDAGRGLYPFTVEAAFYQRVRLLPPAAGYAFAPTWDTEVVGLVSSDRMHLIPESMDALLDAFIEDFLLANPARGSW